MHNTNRICDLAASLWVRPADRRRTVGRRSPQNWIPAILPDTVVKVIEFHTNLAIFLSDVDPATPQLDFAVRRRGAVHLPCKRLLAPVVQFVLGYFRTFLMRIAMSICDLASSL